MKKGHAVLVLKHFLFLLVLAVPGHALAQLYKCTAAGGKVTFSDKPCGGNAEVIELEIPPAPARPVSTEPLLSNSPTGNPEYNSPAGQVSTPPTPGNPIDPRTIDPPVTNPGLGRNEPPLSINAMLQAAGGHPEYIIGFFVALPLLAWTLGKVPVHGTEERPPFRYAYSTLTYLSTIPGVFSAVLVGYSLFFVHQNLLTVNTLNYFLPILSMIVTLVLIGKKVDFNQLPGFDRLAGLIVLIATTFAILLFLYKTRIFIGFFGSMSYLIPLGIFLFFLLKWSTRKLF